MVHPSESGKCVAYDDTSHWRRGPRKVDSASDGLNKRVPKSLFKAQTMLSCIKTPAFVSP